MLCRLGSSQPTDSYDNQPVWVEALGILAAMRIAVVGAGGVGGYFGGRWAEAGLDVTLIARGPHLQAMRDGGLRIVSPLGNAHVEVVATDDPAEVGQVDAIVIATKTWQLAAAARDIAPMVGPDTMVVGLQNGVDASDVICGAVDREHVLGGSCRIISYIEEPGAIHHIGADPTVIFGEAGGGTSKRVLRLLENLRTGAGMTVRTSSDIQTVIWKKFHFLASTAGVGSVTQEPLGVIRSTPELRSRLRQAMDEILAVASARAVALEDTLTDDAMAFVDGLPADGTSSMQRDFAAGRRTELESLSGAVVRLGRESGVPTPVHAEIYQFLLPRELAARRTYEDKQ